MFCLLSGLGSGDSWKAVGCRESGGWTKEHLQLHEHHYKVLQAMLMKQTMTLWMLWNIYKRGNADQDRPRVSRLERKSSEGGLVGRWRGNFFRVVFILSCLHLGEVRRWYFLHLARTNGVQNAGPGLGKGDRRLNRGSWKSGLKVMKKPCIEHKIQTQLCNNRFSIEDLCHITLFIEDLIVHIFAT